jgi:hypothetical protein
MSEIFFKQLKLRFGLKMYNVLNTDAPLATDKDARW